MEGLHTHAVILFVHIFHANYTALKIPLWTENNLYAGLQLMIKSIIVFSFSMQFIFH